MKQVGTFEAKNQFSALLELVAQGEDVLITRHGKPIARLVPADCNFTKPEAEPTKQGYISGQALIDAMQRSAHKEIDLVPPGFPMPVRDVEL